MLFYAFTAVCTLLLMGWGAFVTSINAGLAVPDWPKSFDSWDMLNPWPEWWTMTPVLAEHGHRLLGTLVGMLTIGIAVWTFFADSRKWMRWLGAGALFLVIFQGVLGGLRVTLVSLDLAVVHACVAQIFFATIVSLALFTSKTWFVGSRAPGGADSVKLRGLVAFSTTAVFIQIVFGALLRHPGTGIDTFLATTHIIWAFVVAILIVATIVQVHLNYGEHVALKKIINFAGGLLAVQIVLGFTAFFVLLDEAGLLQPSNLQVVINSSHMLTGALLMSTMVCCALLILRRSQRLPETEKRTRDRVSNSIPETSIIQ
ncbi:MAG: cytochrome oxidase assembly protein [Rhodothermales bacterium]|nr:cytochrome oxidase assembly protein [Rhodothermales bacterium]